MGKRVIRINENTIRKIVKESVMSYLKEGYDYLKECENEWISYWFFDIDTQTLTKDYDGTENGFELVIFPILAWGSCETWRTDRYGAPIGEPCPAYEAVDFKVCDKSSLPLAKKYEDVIYQLLDSDEEKYIEDIERQHNITLDHA